LGSQHQLIIGGYTEAQRDALTSVSSGSILYNTTNNTGQVYNGTEWREILTKSGTGGPGSRSDYPISPSYNSVYTTPWTGNPSNLPIADSTSTWTAPANAVEARVIVVGAGGGWPSSFNGRGRGAYVDALIPITAGASYKVIVGEKGADSSGGGTGGHGCGGGPGVDSNDTGSGSGGSAFFFAPPSATSDPTMFPQGVLIAGSGGGGTCPQQSNAGTGSNTPDNIGGFTGVSAKGTENPAMGEPGGPGGIGGRVRDSSGGSLLGSNAIRGEGGTLQTEGYGNCQGGGGGGAGGGGAGGACPGSGSGEDGPNGRGIGYGSLNTSGAGRGGNYPMRGGNGFTFQGVNLGGGGGGSHGRAAGSGGWGGGGGSLYDLAGGAGGSGAWGYLSNEVGIFPVPSSGPPGITINGGNLGSNTPFPTSAGLENTDGAIIIMWYEP